MNPVIDPFTHKLVSGPEAGQNTEVDGFTVGFIGSTDGTVYNAGSGLTLTGNVFAADVAAVGFGMELAGGTASLARYRAVESVTGSSVTMQAGHAYKVVATTSAVTLNTETIPANQFGLEGHLEIFVSGTGYVVTGSNVVLANALEPDSVNNCTVRFHDGLAIISVEDHIAGYVVVSATGTTAGTLPYALTSATQEYVAFDASLNGATVSLSGSTANGEKHVVGNGYAETILNGNIDCGTSNCTVANLALSDVGLTGGVMTLGDVKNIGTLTFSGGRCVVERVSGGIFDLNGSHGVVVASNDRIANITGCTFTNGVCNENAYNVIGGWNRSWNLENVVASGNTALYGGFAYPSGTGSAVIKIKNCVISGNAATIGNDFFVSSSMLELNGGNKVGEIVCTANAIVTFSSSNTIDRIAPRSDSQGGTVTISSGASVNLTSSIAPGGGITVLTGGCTVNGAEIAAGNYSTITSSGGSAVAE